MNEAEVELECWFLDVGQGSSQVVPLPNGDVIVIDGGDKSGGHVLFECVDDFLDSSAEIPLLVVSHNHADHANGTRMVLQEFAERIRTIAYPQDVPPDKSFVLAQLKELQAEGRMPKVRRQVRLEAESYGGRRLFPITEVHGTGAFVDIELSVVAPAYQDAQDAEELPDKDMPNRLAGIVLLEYGNRTVVFSSDAPIAAWRNFLERRHEKPLACDVVTMPHHGGKLSKAQSLTDDWRWFWTTAVKAEYAVVSVGTDNWDRNYYHPRPEAIIAARRASVFVACTQITEHCCSPVESARSNLLNPLQKPCLSKHDAAMTSSGKNIACASTVVLQMSKTEYQIKRFNDLQTAINALPHVGTPQGPLCQRPV